MSKINRNIAILAHVDAGKTTVSEKILFNSKEINSCGSVDEGLATMDYLIDEKEKGITIETGVHRFNWKGAPFSFLDTPGHLDFSVEVDQALNAADMGILVISGMRGIESRTGLSWQNIQRHDLPSILFLNKLDQQGLDLNDILLDLEEMTNKPTLCFNYPVYKNAELIGVLDILSNCVLKQDEFGKETQISQTPDELLDIRERLFKEIIEISCEFNDEFAEKYLNEEKISLSEIIPGLIQSFKAKHSVPLYFGSAKENIGIRQMMTGINLLLEPKERIYHEKALGEITQYRSNSKHWVYIVKATKQFDSKVLGTGAKTYDIEAGELFSTDTVALNEVFALETNMQLNVGDIIGEGCEVLGNVWAEKYFPLIQTRLELNDELDFEKLNNSKPLHYIDYVSRLQYSISKNTPSGIITDFEGGDYIHPYLPFLGV